MTPTGIASPSISWKNPRARPTLSSPTCLWMRVIRGAWNHARKMQPNPMRATKAQKPLRESRPTAAKGTPTTTVVALMSSARRLPPPQAIMMTAPTSMQVPVIASATDTIAPSAPKYCFAMSG